MGTEGGPSRGWVVLVPAPFQGHITPMLQLGYMLDFMGFNILVAHAEYNSPDPLHHPKFVFLPLPDDVSGYDKSMDNMLSVLMAININCSAPLQDYLVEFLGKQKHYNHVNLINNDNKPSVVTCIIIYDTIMQFAASVADYLHLPTIVMRPYNAAYVLAHHVIFHLQKDSNSLPLPESQLQENVSEMEGFRYKDMPLPLTHEIPENVLEFLEKMMSLGQSRAAIWNTIDELEHPSLSKLNPPVPIFAIGPFHKMAPSSSSSAQTSLFEEDSSCIAWLDKQAPNSVLYVSLGSLATMDEKEFLEMAHGLVKSDQPFLWVVRPDSLTNGSPQLPEGLFQEAIVSGRGYIVKWAPQKKVLAHSAVGAFLSHCGWNSTLESLSEGVPLVCRPHFADQLLNARYVSHVWKVGLEVEPGSGREVIAKTITKVMVDIEGQSIRKRALDMKEKIQACVETGGTSHKSLNELLRFISSLPTVSKLECLPVPCRHDRNENHSMLAE